MGTQSTARHTRQLNLLGSSSYLSCFFQWLLVAVVYFRDFVDSWFFTTVLAPAANKDSAPITPSVATSGPLNIPGWLGIAIIIGGILLTLWLIVFVITKIPKSIVARTAHLTHSSEQTIVHMVSKRTGAKPKQQRQLSSTVMIILKLVGILTPAVTVLAYSNTNGLISVTLGYTIACTLLTISSVAFTAQFLLSRYYKIPFHTLR